MNQSKKVFAPFLKGTIVPSLFLFLFGWGFSFLVSNLIWARDLKPIPPVQLLVSLFLPIIIIIISWLSIKKSNGKTFSLHFFFIIFLVISIVNILLVHFLHIQIYGDFDQLPSEISSNVVFPRWLVGSSFLNFTYHFIIQPIKASFQTAAFVRLSGSFLMLGFSIILLLKSPNRLSVILPLLSPIWFLFFSGYNEYYPFIAEFFLLSLLLLSTDKLVKIHPILIGIFASLIMLLYVGFVPLGLFLIFVLFVKKGARAGITAFFAALCATVWLVLIFWPNTFISFFPAYYSSLNIKSSDLYPGLLMAHLPFFKVSYAFSLDNLTRIFNQYYWAGGPGSLIIMVLFGLKKNIFSKVNLINNNILFLSLFLIWQIFYFIFMVPRLGPYQDIDLFFSVYLTISFMAGFLADLHFESMQNPDSTLSKHQVISFFIGNSSFLILYFCFLGIPYFK